MAGTLEDAVLEFRLRELEAAQESIDSQLTTKASANPDASPTAQVGGTPPRVSGLRLVDNLGTLALEWASSPIRDLLYYDVQVADDAAFSLGVQEFKTGETRFIYTEQEALASKFFRVRAVNADRNPGPWSDFLIGATGKVGTDDLEDNAVNDLASYVKSSGFAALGQLQDGSGGGASGDNETYGPLVVEIEEAAPNTVVSPSIRFEADVASNWSGAGFNYMDLILFRRPQGGADEIIDSASIDFKSQLPSVGSTDVARIVVDPIATLDQPGAGIWEYRIQVIVWFNGTNRIRFQGVSLTMEAGLIKK